MYNNICRHLRCADRNIRCPGTGKFDITTAVFSLKRDHCHNPVTSFTREENNSFVDELKRTAKTQLDNLETLYERVAQL